MQSLAGFIIAILIDTSFSWARMLVALFLSIIISLFVGIYAAINRTAEKIIVPVLDVFQTLPILAFFPFVVFVIVAVLPGFVGINVAVVFLIITSMVWNITFGVYEAVKTLPDEFFEVGKIFNLGPFDRLTKIFIPASMPKVVEQSILSWSVGLFFLVTSEIFSTGNSAYSVKHGIGAELASLAFSGNFAGYIIGIIVFICFVVATKFLLFDYLKRKFTRHTLQVKQSMEEAKRANVIKALDRINPFGKVNLGIMHRNIVSVRAKFAKPVAVIDRKLPKGAIAKKSKPSVQNYRYLAYFATAVVLAFILYAYRSYLPTYLGYEYTVLVSIVATLARIWLAFAAILAVAMPVGVYLIFISKRSNFYLLLFQIIASIPATILLPVIAIALKNAPLHNEIVAFVIFFLSGIWYMIFSIVSNRNSISNSVFEVKSIFGVKGKEAWREIYIKAILPGLITGAITGIAAEWNASILAERFTTGIVGNGTVITSVSVGLGRLLDVSLDSGNIALMVLGLINLTIVIIIVNKLLWKRQYGRVLAPYK